MKKAGKKMKQAEERQGRTPEAWKVPAGPEDSTLQRTTGDAAQEKFRITYEARHLITRYADPSAAEPEQVNWKGALVVKAAVHARLSNITAEGCWKEDEEYTNAGRRVLRTAGKSAGRVLKTYVDLRKKYPEWFAELDNHEVDVGSAVSSISMQLVDETCLQQGRVCRQEWCRL